MPFCKKFDLSIVFWFSITNDSTFIYLIIELSFISNLFLKYPPFNQSTNHSKSKNRFRKILKNVRVKAKKNLEKIHFSALLQHLAVFNHNLNIFQYFSKRIFFIISGSMRFLYDYILENLFFDPYMWPPETSGGLNTSKYMPV